MADLTLEQRLERAAEAMPRLARAVSRDEVYREAARWLADPSGLALDGAAVLLLRGDDLVLAHSTFPQPGRSFRRDQNHRYARLARGEPSGADDAERLVPIAIDGPPTGYLVLRLAAPDRRAEQLSLERFQALFLALGATAGARL